MTPLLHPIRRLPAVLVGEGRLQRRSVWATCLVVSLATPSANASNELALHVGSGSSFVRLGDPITVTLDVADLSVPINGIQAFLHYDRDMMRLVSALGNSSVETGWTGITEDLEGGGLLQLLVMFGGATSIDHTAATLTFEAIALGSTRVSFLADDPPLRTKVTAAADASPILPLRWDSEEIVIVATEIPTVSLWGLATMALLLTTIGSLVMRRNEFALTGDEIRDRLASRIHLASDVA